MTITEAPERSAPAQEAWPLFGIRFEARRGSKLRVVDDTMIPELARVAREGVHEPDHMPFGNGLTDRPEEDWHTGFARYFWRQRGAWDADSRSFRSRSSGTELRSACSGSLRRTSPC